MIRIIPASLPLAEQAEGRPSSLPGLSPNDAFRLIWHRARDGGQDMVSDRLHRLQWRNYLLGRSPKRRALAAKNLLAIMFMTLSGAAVALESETTIVTTYTGDGIVSTYRGTTTMPPVAPTTMRAPSVEILRGFVPPPTRCDQAGIGGFEIVAPLHPGERACIGAVRYRSFAG